MTADPPPPTVTISDPNNPGAYADVLGSGDEKPPWRPSRRQWQVLLAVGLVLLVAVPPTLYLKHRGDERALDRQALDAIELLSVDDGDFDRDEPLILRNNGPGTVTIVAARIDREGYGTSKVGVTLTPDSHASIPLPFLAPCPRAVPQTGPSGVQLTVRTSRGGERVMRVNIRDLSASFAFVGTIQDTCGLYSPDESLDVNARFQISVVGREVVLHANVFNRSVLRRDITKLTLAEGFRIATTPALPLVVPRAQVGFQGDSVPLDARITVQDCVRARAVFAGNAQEQEFDRDALQAEVNGDSNEYPALLFFRGDLGTALEELVSTYC